METFSLRSLNFQQKKLSSFHNQGFWIPLEQEQQDFWSEYSFIILAIFYGAIALFAMIQLVRIHRRQPDQIWTLQKIFHMANIITTTVRCVVFALHPIIIKNVNEIAIQAMFFDIPGLLFYTTYTMLVRFWAEIYRQAKNLTVSNLHITFITANVVIYAIQIALLLVQGVNSNENVQRIAKQSGTWFMAFTSILAAFGFLLYGGRLFVMLMKFPLQSRGRSKKLREVSMVTAICALCFTTRAVFLAIAQLDPADASLDPRDPNNLHVVDHPFLNFLYYFLVEIVPCACVLLILRKLPPKRTRQQIGQGMQGYPTNPTQQGYQPLPTQQQQQQQQQPQQTVDPDKDLQNQMQ